MGDESPHNSAGSNRLTPLIIALIYVALGVAWISLSDRLLESVATDPVRLLQLHT